MVFADANYQYKLPLTIDYTKVAGDETDFNVLVSLTNGNLKSVANGGFIEDSNGYDIAFYNSTEITKLPHEIDSYTATTGEIVIWVKSDISSTSNTVIWMYFGNKTISTDPSSTDTWHSDYIAVYHLKEAAATLDDATSNDYDMQESPGNEPNPTYAVTGKIHKGIELDATAGWFDTEDGNVYDLQADGTFMMEGWVYLDDTNPHGLFEIGHTYAGLYIDSGGELEARSYDGAAADHGVSGFSLAAEAWYHVVGRWAGGAVDFFVNGAPKNQDDNCNNGAAANPLQLGHCTEYSPVAHRYLDGKLDEVRFTDGNWSDNWIETQYNNQNSPSTFMTLGRLVRQTRLAFMERV